MSSTLADLQQRAVELARDSNFGPEALEVNLEITRADATNQGAWTRLARCYLEQRRFADAAGALATVLELNPSNTIARSLLNEVTRRRATALPAAEAASGFGPHDFDALGHLAPPDAGRALGPKLEALLLSVNEQRTSVRIVEARTRAGESGSKLFHRNSYHAEDQRPHLCLPSWRPPRAAVQYRSVQQDAMGRELDSNRTWIQPRTGRPGQRGRWRAGASAREIREFPAAAWRCVGKPPGSMDGNVGRVHPVRQLAHPRSICCRRTRSPG